MLDGEMIDTKLIDHTLQIRGANTDAPSRLVALEKSIVFSKGTDIYVLPIDNEVVRKAPMPLHFPWQPIKPLDINTPQKFTISARGGKGKIEYSLVQEFNGIEIDSSTGEITVDTPMLWKKALGPPSTRDQMRAMQRSSSNQPTASTWYKKITGEELPTGKVPYHVPIHVAVTDEEGQEDRINVVAFVFGDKKAADEVAQKRAKQRAKQQAEARAASEKRREQQMLERKKAEELKLAKAESANGASKDRFDQMERRMRRMEATLDALLEKLDRLESASEESAK